MKSTVICMIATFSLTLGGAALAADMPAFAKNKCGVCHAIDKKLVGPSYNDISAKYKGNAGAVDAIIANVTKGGAFGWKIGKMPPKGAGASDAEIKEMANYIVSLAK